MRILLKIEYIPYIGTAFDFDFNVEDPKAFKKSFFVWALRR